jgi:type VI secretion system protein ImpH
MAAGDGPGAGDLTHYERFCRSPESFHIFQALRVLEARFAASPPLGQSRRPRDDRVRLGQDPALAFPPTTISGYTPPGGQGPGRLRNASFGLFGPHGPLPLHLTEYARERQFNEGDPTFVAFADMLTHRLAGLLYRAWTMGQPAPSFDRGEDGLLERKVAALAGHLGTHLRGRDAMPDTAKRHFAGHLAAGPKNAEALVAMLSGFFRAPVRLQEFVGSWLHLEPSDRWQLGSRTGLGQATSIGGRVWARGAKFRLLVGPLALDDYSRLLPGRPAMRRLAAVVRNHAGDALDWDVNLILRADQVPPAVLGRNTALGHVAWIGRRRSAADAGDLLITQQQTQTMPAQAA